MIRFYFLLVLLNILICVEFLEGQDKKKVISFSDFAQYYPLGKGPYIRLISSYTSQETILFDAYPVLRLSVFNNFVKGLLNDKDWTQAWYISFRPHLRIYTDNSLPVKTPSYRILLGTQHMIRITPKKLSSLKEHFMVFYLESGHYSNGQANCAFSEDINDGSPDCDSIYGLINSSTNLSEVLNRESGNYSTNLTELIINYRQYTLNSSDLAIQMHSVSIGYTLYHDKMFGVLDKGGYTEEDIKIYGKQRFLIAYEYMTVLKKGKGPRISIKQDLEIINGAHEFVNPFRSETMFSIFPFQRSKAIGFFTSYIYGHDNYNYRFVDSGHQFSVGIRWDQFPPITMKGPRLGD